LLADQEEQLDPLVSMMRALQEAKLHNISAFCPECFTNQMQWYCASLFPKCGSIRSSMDSTLLPIIAQVELLPAGVKLSCLEGNCTEFIIEFINIRAATMLSEI